MATAAFRSTTRRAAAAKDAGSSNRDTPRRRARSLSHYCGRFPPPPPDDSEDFSTPRGRFVNKVRGSGFPEISLDDLADELFGTRTEESEGSTVGHSERRISSISPREETGSSRLRGRSVSRFQDRTPPQSNGSSDVASRRRRSISAARYRCSDSENDMNFSHNSCTQPKLRNICNGKIQQLSVCMAATGGHALRRSMSQKDLLQTEDSLSSHSSSLTDDEVREACPKKNRTDKTIQAVYSQEKIKHPSEDEEGVGLYETMRKEVRNAVMEIRTELEKAMVDKAPASLANGEGSQPKSSNVVQVIADIRRNCTTKLEQSEKRMQDLLAELAVEEQRGQELTKIVKELLPTPKQTLSSERPAHSRRRANDKTNISKRLTEEAERYFEGFLSNVEDTDKSSIDGERSDTSSNIGRSVKLREPVMLHALIETQANLGKADSLPVETDGVVLPWLEWETSNDASPSPCKIKATVPFVSANSLLAAAKVASRASVKSIQFATSHRTLQVDGSSSLASQGIMRSSSEVGGNNSISGAGREKCVPFDMDEYLLLQENENLIFERVRQRHRVESGGLLLCGRNLF